MAKYYNRLKIWHASKLLEPKNYFGRRLSSCEIRCPITHDTNEILDSIQKFEEYIKEPEMNYHTKFGATAEGAYLTGNVQFQGLKKFVLHMRAFYVWFEQIFCRNSFVGIVC